METGYVVKNATLLTSVPKDESENENLYLILLTVISGVICAMMCGIVKFYCDKGTLSVSGVRNSTFRMSRLSFSTKKRKPRSPNTDNSEDTEELSPRGSVMRTSFSMGFRESIYKLMGIGDGENHKGKEYDPNNGSYPDESQLNWLLGTLKYSKILLEYNEQERKEVVGKMRRLILPAGHTLVKQGMIGTDLYVLEQGALNVFIDNNQINSILPGWAFGELGFLFSTPRSSTCITKMDSVVWVLTREALESAVGKEIGEMEPPPEVPLAQPNLRHFESTSTLDVHLENAPNFQNKFDFKKLDTSNSIRSRVSLEPASGHHSLDKSPRLNRVISGQLLNEIKQQEYVGMPEIVSNTLRSIKDEEAKSCLLSIHEVSPPNSSRRTSDKSSPSHHEVSPVSAQTPGAQKILIEPDGSISTSASTSSKNPTRAFVFFE